MPPMQGFLKATGLKPRWMRRRSRRDPKKGDFYVALIEKPGRAAIDVLAEILPVIIRTFPWPKSMRWGERSAKPGALTWVRPLHSIIATFGPETEEPDVVKFSRRRHRGRADHARPSLHGAGSDLRCAASRTTKPS